LDYLDEGYDGNSEVDELRNQVEQLRKELSRTNEEIQLLRDLLGKSDMRFDLLLQALAHHDNCPTKCWGTIDGETDIKSMSFDAARIKSAVNKAFRKHQKQS
jgi:predicted nuclease with TOPRIM domain